MGSEVNEDYLKALGGYGADRVYYIDSPLLKAVSYTHLDVYKRQIKGCVHNTSVYAAQTVGLMQGIARFPGGHTHQIPSVSGLSLIHIWWG